MPAWTIESTHRAHYKPFTEAHLQVYQFPGQPQRKPSPPSIRPPMIDEDTWAKWRRYCYRTTNSIYGSSTFTQKGKSLMASVLQRDHEPPVPPKAKEDQRTPSTADEEPSTTAAPPQGLCQPTQVPPAEGKQPTAVAATSTSQISASAAVATSTAISSASSAPASGPATTTVTAASSAKQSHSCSPGIKATLKSDTNVAKEALPAAKDTAKVADKLPQIGSGEGGSVQDPRKQADMPKPVVSYEDFLQNMCNWARQERLLNQRSALHTAAVLGGVHPQYSSSYKGSFRKLQQDDRPFRGITSKLPNPDIRQRRLCFVSEYADKFGLLQRTFPPSTHRNFTPVEMVRPQVAVQPRPRPPPPPRRTMCSEYMESYRHPPLIKILAESPGWEQASGKLHIRNRCLGITTVERLATRASEAPGGKLRARLLGPRMASRSEHSEWQRSRRS
ncbi:hypothetical protein ACEWY4_025236 [Coilia grayii]|uniref:Uncharacterized protein n=1 Tax=Coilia grayii TaxID=363190 RepID=A0ABD1IX03_9TELE